jgi:hypothetical protein
MPESASSGRLVCEELWSATELRSSGRRQSSRPQTGHAGKVFHVEQQTWPNAVARYLRRSARRLPLKRPTAPDCVFVPTADTGISKVLGRRMRAPPATENPIFPALPEKANVTSTRGLSGCSCTHLVCTLMCEPQSRIGITT